MCAPSSQGTLHIWYGKDTLTFQVIIVAVSHFPVSVRMGQRVRGGQQSLVQLVVDKSQCLLRKCCMPDFVRMQRLEIRPQGCKNNINSKKEKHK